MDSLTLTKSEKEIMDLLWNTDRPLTASEIVNLTPERTWKKSYIHLLINSLLSKQLIKPDALARTGRNFGRTFAAAMTSEEYAVLQITNNRNFSPDSIPPLVSALLDVTDNIDIIEKTEAVIKEKKESLQ